MPSGGHGRDISHLNMLIHLDFGGLRIEGDSMELLAPQLQLPSLEYLYLRVNSVGPSGVHHLVQCLPKLTCLRHLAVLLNS